MIRLALIVAAIVAGTAAAEQEVRRETYVPHWRLERPGDDRRQRSPRLYFEDMFERQPGGGEGTLRYPRATFRCGGFSTMTFSVSRLTAAQRFPQPPLTLTIGRQTRTATPNADYHPATPPDRLSTRREILEKLDPRYERFRNATGFPGHSAYASFEINVIEAAAFLAALRAGGPLEVRFNDQVARFPAIPADLAADFAEAC